MDNKIKNIWQFFASANIKKTLGIIGLVAIVMAIPLTIFIAQKQQEIRQRAAGTEPAILLGRVFDTDPKYSSCHQQLYFYGDNCGNDSSSPPCFGAPNYTITWTQGGKSKSISNNSCYPSDGPDRPRFTFEGEDEDNPRGDADGEEVTISIAMAGEVRLASWRFEVMDAAKRLVFPGSQQSGTFANPGPNQTITLKVYRQGDYMWNLLGVIASPSSPTPTSAPTPVPPTATPILATPTPTPTPPPPTDTPMPPTTTPRIAQCNQTCLSAGYTCAAGLICYQPPGNDIVGNDKCRNPACPEKEDCQCSGTGVPLHLSLSLQGIGPNIDVPGGGVIPGNQNPVHVTRNVLVEVFGIDNQKKAEGRGDVGYDPVSKLFKASIYFPNLSAGSYYFKVKTNKYLRKLIPGVHQISTTGPNNLPQTTLIVGDINNDNMIDLRDYVLYIGCFGKKADDLTSCPDKVAVDLNDDGENDGPGKITKDYRLLINSFQTQQGD